MRPLVDSIRADQPKEVTVRLETPPGEVAQVDFGFVGCVIDPATSQPRKTWAFTMVLGYSRHQFAELVFDQTIPTWLLCHQLAFEHFGGGSCNESCWKPQSFVLHRPRDDGQG